jgi:hypothetical protein
MVVKSNFENPILEVSRESGQVLFAVEWRLSEIHLKGVDKAQMKRLVIKAIIKMCVESILITTMIGVAIGFIGYINKWTSPIAYSNAFFLAGCLVIIAGTSSRLAAGQGNNNHQLLYAESFRKMSSSERANFIIDSSSSLCTVILGLLSGILLILISAIAMNMS